LIGDDNTVEIRMPGAVGIAPSRIEMQADRVRGVGPLCTERDRRTDDDQLLGTR
jgi:hypothetical protein